MSAGQQYNLLGLHIPKLARNSCRPRIDRRPFPKRGIYPYYICRVHIFSVFHVCFGEGTRLCSRKIQVGI